MNITAAFVFILVVIVVIYVGWRVAASARPGAWGGAAGDTAVIDTLNLTHALTKKKNIVFKDIMSTIDNTAQDFKKKYKSVIYVLKTRESDATNVDAVREEIEKCVARNHVQVALAASYADPPPKLSGRPTPGEVSAHSIRARDDFLLLLLADRFKAKIITNDKLRDASTFRANLEPFRMITYNWWSAPVTESIIPDAVQIRHRRRLI